MITLTAQSATATINPEGAWVESLTNGDVPVLFAKTELVSDSGDRKVRGGMHMCLPNFGPGGDSGLAQHGFGRTMTWHVAKVSDTSVTLTLQGPSPRYANLAATVMYAIFEDRLESTVTLRATGGTSIRVAPGFHPYFALSETDTAVSVNDHIYEISDLMGTKFIEAETLDIKTSGRHLVLKQQGLPVWALWSDLLGNYVCAEPTYGGYRFLEAPHPEEYLAPETDRIFGCTISW